MRSVLLAALVAIAAGACTDTLDLQAGGTPTPSPTFSPSPTPTAVPTPDFGDGHDGAFTAPSGTSTVNVCRPVVSGADTGIEVTDASGLANGRRVVVHQAQA